MKKYLLAGFLGAIIAFGVSFAAFEFTRGAPVGATPKACAAIAAMIEDKPPWEMTPVASMDTAQRMFDLKIKACQQ